MKKHWNVNKSNLEIHNCKICGKTPKIIYKWSVSFTTFVKCECGNRSDDWTSDSYDLAKIKAIRNWNRQNKIYK